MFRKNEDKPTTASVLRDARMRHDQVNHDHNREYRQLTRSQAIALSQHYLAEMLLRTRKYVKEEANVDGIIAEFVEQSGPGKTYATKQLALIALKADQRFVSGVGDAAWFRSGAELMSRLHDSLILHVQELDRLADRRHGSQ
jgi:hypothetical protein